MKKNYKSFVLFIGLFLSIHSFAVVHSISVLSSSFSPNTINVNVGDTIHWILSSSVPHTTTSTQIPSGADPWNSPINSNTTEFNYVVAVLGTYNYECSIHGFVGQFVALNTGITSPNNFSNLIFFNSGSSTYNLTYSLVHSSEIKISLFDITGRMVRVLNSSMQPPGNYVNSFSFEDLQKGIYLFEMYIGNYRITKRLIIE